MIGIVMKREFSVLLAAKSHRAAVIIVGLLILIAGVVARFALPAVQDQLVPAAPRIAVGVETQMAQFEPILKQTVGVTQSGLATGAGKAWVKEQQEALQDAADQDSTSDKDNAPGSDSAANKDEKVRFVALGGTPSKPIIYSTQSMIETYSEGTAQVFGQALTLAGANAMIPGGLTAAQQGQLMALANPRLVNVETTANTNVIESNPGGYIAGTVACALLLFTVAMGMGAISQGVVEEKASRIVEILVSTVRPRQLLFGKILGIGAFVVLELVIWLACTVAALLISGAPIPVGFNLSGTIGWIMVWVILGFLIFATLVGGISAMVSRQEDLAAVQTPIIFLMIIPFYLALYLVPYQPDALITKIFSWIPGFSSFLMPMRFSLNNVLPWEPWGALAVALLSLPLFVGIAGRIYQNSVLRMGKRVSWKDALRRR